MSAKASPHVRTLPYPLAVSYRTTRQEIEHAFGGSPGQTEIVSVGSRSFWPAGEWGHHHERMAKKRLDAGRIAGLAMIIEASDSIE